MTAYQRIMFAMTKLGQDEMEVLAEVADGLLAGRTEYGELKLDQDRRDMAAEALEEVRDGLVYVGAQLVKFRRCSPGPEILRGRLRYIEQHCKHQNQVDARPIMAVLRGDLDSEIAG